MNKILFLQSAQEDLESIFMFCSNISIQYANKIQNEILNYIYSLQLFPKAYPKVSSKNNVYELRTISMKRYKIFYVIYKNSIYIVRIVDIRQNKNISFI